MRRGASAEWVLARIIDADQASAIIGDLLEQNESRIQFWLGIARIVLRLTWRWALAIPLSYFLASVTAQVFKLQLRIDMGRLHQSLQWSHFFWGNYVVVAAACFGICAGIGSAIFGLRDRLTVVSLALWALWTGCLVLAWMPHTEREIIPLLGITTLGLVAIPATRSAALSVLAASIVFLTASYAGFFLFAWTTGINVARSMGFSSFLIVRLISELIPIGLSAVVLTNLRPQTAR